MRVHTDLPTINELDDRAVRHSLDLVRQVTAGSLSRPTPCADWRLADLLAHMTAQHRGFAAAADGRGGDRASWAVRPSEEDPVAGYRAAADEVRAAFAAVASPDQPFLLVEISAVRPFPAVVAIGFHFIDYVVHGWDVARSLGIPFDPQPDLLEAALPVALAVPDGEPRRQNGALFQPRLAGPDDASVLDRILAALGRSPRWPDPVVG